MKTPEEVEKKNAVPEGSPKPTVSASPEGAAGQASEQKSEDDSPRKAEESIEHEKSGVARTNKDQGKQDAKDRESKIPRK